jgi:diadenosine tetraphosphate (Ap4A) HIT family hydrolase
VSEGLEQLWAGWRHRYVTEATDAERVGPGGPGADCVFCRLAASGPPSADNGVVWRGETCFCVLNAYPYANGHLLVLPTRHVERLDELRAAESAELWSATQQAVAAITAAYCPDGLNVGANLGRAAGAGIPQHVHLHVLPRWSGDTNFMTAVAGVRVMPQSLTDSWEQLRPAFASGGESAPAS